MIKILFLLLSIANISSCSISETQLRNEIMQNYDKQTLPRKNSSFPIYLKMGIAIRAFESINQVDGTIDSNVWLRYWWKDRLLSWDPKQYENISSIAMFTQPDVDGSIWTPDIYLYNTAETPLCNLEYSKAILRYDGSITWSRPGMIKSTCVFNLKFFPYDEQHCYLKFGSWVYNHQNLNLKKGTPSIDISNMQKNDGWMLTNYSSSLNIQKYECCPEEFSDITYNFTLRRKPGYYNLNIVIPTFATAVLMLLSFIVPWDSGERISFATTVMLSIIVFLLILSDSLPKTDTRPLLSEMLIGLTFFSLFVVFFTVVISSMYSYDSKKNNMFNKLFSRFKCFVCNKEIQKKKLSSSQISRTNININAENEIDLDVLFQNSDSQNKNVERNENNENTNKNNEINKNDEDNKNDKINKNDENKCVETCENLASKLEVILTFLFIVSFICFSLAIFNSIPSYN